MVQRPWTQEEESYLEEKWGQLSYSFLSKKLNRSKKAIKLKSERLKLPGIYNTGEYLNANDVAKMLNIDIHTVINYWIPKYGLKANKKVLKSDKRWFIKIDNLMEWLKHNTDKWDSRKIELYDLGTEPKWLKDKRKQDLNLPKRQKQKWTKQEINSLIFYYRQGRTHKNIGKLLGRSETSIQRKLSRLKGKNIIPKQKIICKWSNREEELLRNLEDKGLTDKEIAMNLGREKDQITDHRRVLRGRGIYIGRKHMAC